MFQFDDLVEVYVSNLPNNAPKQDIIQYLQTAGPIKSFSFNEDGQKRSVNIVYYDSASAEIAKKYLAEKQFLGRDLKISVDLKRTQLCEEEHILRQIMSLNRDEKLDILSYLKNLKNQEGKLFLTFLAKNPKLVSVLLNLRY